METDVVITETVFSDYMTPQHEIARIAEETQKTVKIETINLRCQCLKDGSKLSSKVFVHLLADAVLIMCAECRRPLWIVDPERLQSFLDQFSEVEKKTLTKKSDIEK